MRLCETELVHSGRSRRDALRWVGELLDKGHVHVVDVDLKGYFDGIPHARLMARVETKIADGPTLRLIERFLKADILEDASSGIPRRSSAGSRPQPASQEHLLALSTIRWPGSGSRWCGMLTTSWFWPDGGRRHPCAGHNQGLGGRERSQHSPDEDTDRMPARSRSTFWTTSSAARTTGLGRKASRSCETRSGRNLTNNGRSLHCVIVDVNRVLKGWFAYFQHSSLLYVYSNTYA